MSYKASFRVMSADLITTRTDYLILNPYDLFIGSIEPSNLDYLEENITISVEPIKFDRESSGLVTGFYGAGYYYKQIETTKIVMSSVRPIQTLRTDEYGFTGTDSGGSEPVIGGFLFIGLPDANGVRKVIYRGILLSSIVPSASIVSMWLQAINTATVGFCEIELRASSDPFVEIDAYTLKYPNMPGPHTADLVYDSEFLPACEP